MDDVDRLFQCFKCGVSPPHSAARGKIRVKRKLKQDQSPKLQASTISESKRANSKMGKQISPVIFYGSPNGVPPKRPARLLRLLREIRDDLAEQNKLREEVWRTFPRQNEAIKFTKPHMNARIFSYQDHMNGQRRFLVRTYKEFWRRYKEMNSKFRHHYEVIQEGLPCLLYFDLEFSKRENADKNGDEMVDLLLNVVFDALLKKYSIEGTEDFVVELDSSTEDKFSRHLIIHLPKIAFKDNSHAGAFVGEICSRIQSYIERDKNYDKLFVSKGSNSADKDSHLFVDTAVYSRSRCLRLPFSSKAGKISFLIPSWRFKCKDMLTSDDQNVSGGPVKFDLDAYMSDASRTYLMGKSPFPFLDAFVEAIASTGNAPGKIRSWFWFSEYGLMVYSMSRNRYCERIGREHKSNHVIYVVDLRKAAYYQKFHDPDCKGYRSPLRPLPDDIIPDPNFYDPSGESENQGHTFPPGDERLTDSCSKEEWWREAIKVAEEVEKIQKAVDLTQFSHCTGGNV